MRYLLILLYLTCGLAWAAPAEIEYFKTLPGVKVKEVHDWGSAWEARYELTGNGYATMERIRLWLGKQGWSVKDQDASAGGVMSRRLDAVKGGRKLAVTATQQNRDPGRMMVGIKGK